MSVMRQANENNKTMLAHFNLKANETVFDLMKKKIFSCECFVYLCVHFGRARMPCFVRTFYVAKEVIKQAKNIVVNNNEN